MSMCYVCVCGTNEASLCWRRAWEDSWISGGAPRAKGSEGKKTIGVSKAYCGERRAKVRKQDEKGCE